MAILDLAGTDLRVNSVTTNVSSTGGVTSASQAAGSTHTVTTADKSKVILLDTATGSTVTLPAATGTGNTYRFLVSVLATSNNHIVKVANSTDVMQGSAYFADTDGTAAINGFITASSSDTITLNRTTTGSVTTGETIELQDYAAGFWRVEAFLSNTGTPGTPFSATV